MPLFDINRPELFVSDARLTAVRSWVRTWWTPVYSPNADDGGGVSDEENERRIIAAVQRGGPEGQVAFRTLVEMHQRWLVWFLTCLIGNQVDAEDVAQEVLVRAFLGIEQFRGDAKFRTWLRRIAINQAFNYRRAGVRHRHTDLDDRRDVESHDRYPEALVARDTLLHCMEQLPYVSREILVLYHVEELSMKEVATTLDIGLSAAKMRLKRARDNFKEVFEEDLGEEMRV